MNPPSRTDYAFANPLTVAAILCFSFCHGARFFLDLANGDVPPLLMPILAVLLCKRMAEARKHIAACNACRREEPSGEATPDAERPAR